MLASKWRGMLTAASPDSRPRSQSCSSSGRARSNGPASSSRARTLRSARCRALALRTPPRGRLPARRARSPGPRRTRTRGNRDGERASERRLVSEPLSELDRLPRILPRRGKPLLLGCGKGEAVQDRRAKKVVVARLRKRPPKVVEADPRVSPSNLILPMLQAPPPAPDRGRSVRARPRAARARDRDRPRRSAPRPQLVACAAERSAAIPASGSERRP